MFGRLAMGFANVRAGTRVLMLVCVIAGKSISLGTENTELTTSTRMNVSSHSIDLLADSRLDLSAGDAVSVNTTDMQLGPSSRKTASRSVRRELLTPQFNPGSRYRLR